MNAIEILVFDHQKVKKLFEQSQVNPDQNIVEKVFRELEIHTKVEEEIFYPSVKNNVDSDLIEESLDDHTDIKDLIERLRGIDINDEEFKMVFQELIETVESHVDIEETELFPQVEGKMASELDNLGKRIKLLKDQLERGTATRATSS
ncbi:MAG: hemerythrin domain-containing protein [Acidobacteriota bacterium]